MSFTREQLEKAKTAKSAEELLAFAKENGVEMTAEEAEKHYAELHKSGELSDDELDNVSGGCGDDEPEVTPHTIPLDTVVEYSSATNICPVCGAPMTGSSPRYCSVDAKFGIQIRPADNLRAEEYYVVSNDYS